MWRIKRAKIAVSGLLFVGLVFSSSAVPVMAETMIPAIVIAQLKITSSNGQFILLYNATDTALDMSKYQLEYFNNYDLTKATSSRLITLSGSLPPHGYYLVNDSQMLVCYQLSVDSVSLGFSSTSGLVQIVALNQNSPGAYASPVVQDYVGWSKSVATGAQTLPTNTSASLLRQPVDAQNNPNVSAPGVGSWLTVQPDSTNPCDVVTIVSPLTRLTTLSATLLPSIPPPVIVVTSPASESTTPPVNDGLMSPQLTELLPNPLGTGNDATDEFIEIYNANQVTFDLSGFNLQSGITALHSFILPSGSVLKPQSYTVFYAKQTGLSLSNSGGQVKLLDPTGTLISSTEPYSSAKDGQSWALADDNWTWTNVPTPGNINVINQPVTAKITTKTPQATAANLTKVATSSSPPTGSITASKSSTQTADLAPVHNWTLALVAVAALLYGAYEYRADLGNRINQFRKYLRHRRADWAPTTWWRSHRTNQ